MTHSMHHAKSFSIARDTSHRWATTATMLVICAVSATLVSACRSGQVEGDAGGRMDIYRTTDADRASSMAHAPSLWEFSDIIAESLITDLTEIDRIRRKSTRAVLEMGDLNNRTDTPTADFEAVQHRIRGKLLTSRLIRDHFLVVESVSRIDGQANGAFQGSDLYDPEDTFLLLGNFYESGRDRTRRYYFEFSLVHVASREIVDNWHYDLAQN